MGFLVITVKSKKSLNAFNLKSYFMLSFCCCSTFPFRNKVPINILMKWLISLLNGKIY